MDWLYADTNTYQVACDTYPIGITNHTDTNSIPIVNATIIYVNSI